MRKSLKWPPNFLEPNQIEHPGDVLDKIWPMEASWTLLWHVEAWTQDLWVSPLVSGTQVLMADPLSPVGWEVGPQWIWGCHCYMGLYLFFRSVRVLHECQDAGSPLTPGSALSRWFVIGQREKNCPSKLTKVDANTKALWIALWIKWSLQFQIRRTEFGTEQLKIKRTDKWGTGENGFKKKKATTNKTNWSLKTERKHCWGNKTNNASVNVCSGT